MPLTANTLRAWRKRCSLSQRAAADALGISIRQFNNYENDRAAIPKAIGLACAALALGIDDYNGGEVRPGIIEKEPPHEDGQT